MGSIIGLACNAVIVASGKSFTVWPATIGGAGRWIIAVSPALLSASCFCGESPPVVSWRINVRSRPGGWSQRADRPTGELRVLPVAVLTGAGALVKWAIEPQDAGVR
ncbi:hypothetical protein [Kamptonema formosum]|uniref:hypothetical protein n=1 Tax=Kamptonema formosum TaxID=331992 RepID=UPI0012DF590F|nr:hypothetical protein [Oscillatoria sp. PCC 10802]